MPLVDRSLLNMLVVSQVSSSCLPIATTDFIDIGQIEGVWGITAFHE